jgi:ribosomal-protein-alanine N-acetyltransferase
MIFKQLVIEDLAIACDIDKNSNLSPWSLHDYQQSFKDDNHFLMGLFDEDQLLGFCVYSVVLDEAEILQLVVQKSSQGNGYGYTILNKVCDILSEQSITQLFLEVMVGNSIAINLYHKISFNIIGKRKNYYNIDGKRFDAILMAKTFFNFGHK